MAEIEALVVKIEIIFKDGDWDRGLAIQNRKNSQFKNSPIPTGRSLIPSIAPQIRLVGALFL
ncbi:hypothetical protein CDL15_Pgr007054 [Punica granatum]|uniref:Uncharacterized protein n=1 Tax=Punica granatum TaxID=22663 RepID=A0A218X7V5_PUNGR|nr:hypothetical protein CDL15_Pgr007054 [Punica granatum]